MRSRLQRGVGYVAVLALLFGVAGQARAERYTVEVRNFAFDPAELTIVEGDTVVWVWVNGTHSTTSVDCPCCVCLWDSEVQPTGCPPYQYEYTFTTAGDYDYYCIRHVGLGMVGTIHVRPGEGKVAARLVGFTLPAVALCVCGLCGYVRYRRHWTV